MSENLVKNMFALPECAIERFYISFDTSITEGIAKGADKLFLCTFGLSGLYFLSLSRGNVV